MVLDGAQYCEVVYSTVKSMAYSSVDGACSVHGNFTLWILVQGASRWVSMACARVTRQANGLEAAAHRGLLYVVSIAEAGFGTRFYQNYSYFLNLPPIDLGSICCAIWYNYYFNAPTLFLQVSVFSTVMLS